MAASSKGKAAAMAEDEERVQKTKKDAQDVLDLFNASDDDDDDSDVESEEEESDEEEEEEEEDSDDELIEQLEEERPKRKTRGKGGASTGKSKQKQKKKKRKKKGSQFIEEEAEESDEESEGDGDGDGDGEGPSKKRSKFIDDMAAIGDEDEDDLDFDMDDPFLMDEQNEIDQHALKTTNMNKMYRQVDAKDKFQTDEDLEKFVRERYMQKEADYGDYADMGEMDLNIEEATGVEQQSLLPSVNDGRDPMLWLVKVRRGKEKDIVTRLMQKAIHFEQEWRKNGGSGPRVRIVSAMHHSNLKGFIYVESRKVVYVKQAIAGLQDVYQSMEIHSVPNKEMPEALTLSKSTKVQLQPDSWVRIRGGLYKGDLARVVKLLGDGSRVKVKIVPRLDYKKLQEDFSKEKGKRGKGRNTNQSKMRILAKGFNIEEARQYRLQVIQRRDYESGDTVYWLGEMQFKDGYQIRDASLRGLMPNVKPTYDELQKFHAAKIKDGQGGEDADPNELYDETLKDAAALEEADDGDLTASKACARFSRGDNVIVVKGDLKNLVGTITKIDEAKGLVEIKPEHEELTDLLDIDALQVEKYFSVGNHVKVVRGKYEGSTGMVVNVKDNIASVFSDVTQEEMKVFLRDLMDCTEVTHGMTKFGDMYNLLDLVQLDDMSTGVIVSVEKEACRVLTNKTTGFGQEVRTCRLQNIMRKIHASKLTGLDVFNNIINSGDIVKILQGDWKGKTGTVKHVAKHNYIFVECRDVLQNLGIICVKAKSCNVVGGEKGYNGGAAANQQGAGARDQRSTGARKSFRSLQRDSPLIGKSITVRSGPYKRYRGKVVDANDRTVRLELEAQCKVVTVQHSQLSEGDQGILRGSFHTPAVADVYTPATVQSSGGAGRYGPLGSMAAPGSKTPMHMGGVYGSQTPNPYAAGSQTPNPYAAGSQTPNPYGSQTPAKTPVRERDGGFSIGTPFRVTEDENPSGYNATASFRNQMKASQVDPNLLMNVVLYSENMKQYGKVINIMARENQVTLQLGSYSAGGFESSGLTEDLSLQDLQLAKPVRNGQVRIVTGENKQKGDEYCTFMQEFEDDGTALVRALGDQATVNIVQIQNLAYVLT